VSPTRRELLLTAARWGAGGTLFLTLGGCGPEAGCRPVAVRLGSLLDARARPVGEAYLRRHPEERSGDGLVAALLGDASTPPPDATAALAAAIRADFASGRVVPLRGWRLSRTECRLAALAALCGDRGGA
jgi:hypothetical protein